ncbi:MAG: hypothetical protein V7709_15675 [Halioglobus sp.]
MKLFNFSFALLLVLFSIQATSAQAEMENSADATRHGEHFHKNVAGVVLGITHAGRRKNGPALALEYERRFNESFGVGGIIEYTGGDAEVWVAAIPFAYHTGHWKFYVAPGVEDGHHGTEELVRLGGEYAFELSSGWEVAPQLNVDFVDGDEVLIFGVLFARGF